MLFKSITSPTWQMNSPPNTIVWLDNQLLMSTTPHLKYHMSDHSCISLFAFSIAYSGSEQIRLIFRSQPNHWYTSSLMSRDYLGSCIVCFCILLLFVFSSLMSLLCVKFKSAVFPYMKNWTVPTLCISCTWLWEQVQTETNKQRLCKS